MAVAFGPPDLGAVPPWAGTGPAAPSGPVVVALGPGASAERVVRRAAELAALRQAPLVGVCVRDTSGAGTAVPRGSRSLQRVLGEFGGRFIEVSGTDIALELARFAEREHAAILVVGDTSRSRGRRLVHGSIARRTLRLIGPVEVYVVPPGACRRSDPPGAAQHRAIREQVAPPPRRPLPWVLAVVAPVALMAALSPARPAIGLGGALACGLVAVVAVALAGRAGPVILATAIALASAALLFAVPLHGLRIGQLAGAGALTVFGAAGVAAGLRVRTLAVRARQTARWHAEAGRLARLVACGMAEPAKPPAELAAGLRAAFALDATGILSRGADGWRVVAAAGGPVPDHPYRAQFAAEIGPGRVLVLSGEALSAGGTSPLRVFAGELLLARRRSQLEALNAMAASPHAEAFSGTRGCSAGWPEGRKRTPQPGTVMK
jgi:two-component system, OmpR family, sensor histidine kinase KdpD